MIIIITALKKHKMLGLLTGIVFGFLLQRGGVTDFNVLMGQLLLTDHTVFKVILTAIITGMIGIYYMKSKGIVELQLKSGSIGSLILGGLIFGIGFGILGYCPGTLVGAVGQGSLDALIGGLPGIILGAGFYAYIYPKVQNSFLEKQPLKKLSLPEYFNINPNIVVFISSIILILFLILLEF